MKTKALCLTIAYTLTNNAIAASGCCSWHGGVAGCSASGKSVCADGSISPSCTCTPPTTPTVTPTNPTATCTPKSETRTVACDHDMVGSVTQQRDYSCVTPTIGTWSGWRDINTQCMYGAILGTVNKVIDGDTVHFVPANTADVKKVRIAEIDAPERCQAGGDQARAALLTLLLNKTVTLTQTDTDKYGRLVGHITGEHFTGTISAYQVEHGNAWVYVQYSTDPALRVLEQSARDGKVGLWADENPIPPWDWRDGNYPCVSVCR